MCVGVENGKAAKKGRRRKKGPTPVAQATPDAPPPHDVKDKGRKGGNKARQKEAESSATRCAVCPPEARQWVCLLETGHSLHTPLHVA